MKFTAELDIEVADHDVDIMDLFSTAILDRFHGTAIKISNIRVVKKDEAS